MGALRPGRPPAGPQPRSGPGQHRPGRPLRPRQERPRGPSAPQRDRPGRTSRPRPVHRPAHRARRKRPQLARRAHRHRGRLPRGSAAGPGRRARADLSRHLDPQSPATTSHGYRRGRHRLPDGLDLRRPRSRCPAHRSWPRLVPGADTSISTALGQAFEAKGLKVITGASVQALERRGEQVIIGFTRGGPAEHAQTEAAFAAVGWPANLQSLDLDAAGVTGDPRALSRSMTTCAPTSSTSSPPATSTAAPSWSKAPGSKAASRPGTPSTAPPASPDTTWCPAAASPTPSTARSA